MKVLILEHRASCSRRILEQVHYIDIFWFVNKLDRKTWVCSSFFRQIRDAIATISHLVLVDLVEGNNMHY